MGLSVDTRTLSACYLRQNINTDQDTKSVIDNVLLHLSYASATVALSLWKLTIKSLLHEIEHALNTA